MARILHHYADDFEMFSPLIVERMKEPSGMLRGKMKVAEYWRLGLAAAPPATLASVAEAISDFSGY